MRGLSCGISGALLGIAVGRPTNSRDRQQRTKLVDGTSVRFGWKADVSLNRMYPRFRSCNDVEQQSLKLHRCSDIHEDALALGLSFKRIGDV